MDNIKTQASIILEFYRSLQPDFPVGEGVEIMNPFSDSVSWGFTKKFYEKFYNDQKPRKIIFGINPG
ncbi:MAG: uracil-DNA glycosylase family protein, partial [Flavitalea sp.]